MHSETIIPFNYKYYVVEILDPQYEELERFFCILASWIRMKESDQRVLISFPLDEEVSVTKQRVKDGKEFLANWTVLVADVKYGTDSYEDGINYIIMIENRLLQEKSYAEIIKEHESLYRAFELTGSHEILTEPINSTNDIPEKEPEAVEVCAAGNEKMSKSPQALQDALEVTGQSVATSNDSNNETYEACLDDGNIKNNNSEKSIGDLIKLIFETDFLEQFKRRHSSLEEHSGISKVRDRYINLSSIMKKIINLVENYKKSYIDQPHGTTSEDGDVGVEETEKDECIVNEETETNTAQEIEESKDTNGIDKIIDNDRNVQHLQQKKTLVMKGFTLPEEYNENDSRWTLRYPENKPGLVELIPYSRVYVNAIQLQNFKLVSHNGRTFARLLLGEIFSDNALSVCSITGRIAYVYKSVAKKYTQRPGLDENARIVLFNYVEEYGKERNWPDLGEHSITSSVRNKLREIRANAYQRQNS